MLLRPLLAAAGLTAAANAFLLPPEISAHDIEVVEVIPFESVSIAQTQNVQLDCPGCPPVSKKHNGKPKHHKQHTSHLELDFSVNRSGDSDHLMLNGFELYPNSDPFRNTLVASQVVDKPKHHPGHKTKGKHEGDNSNALPSHHKFKPGEGKSKSVEQQLGFSLQIHPVANTADDNMNLVVVDLQIIEVGSVFVDGLPNVRIHLINSPQNELLIGKIEQTASETVATPMEDEKECTTTLCKWKAIIADQIAKMKMGGCAGMMGAKAGHGHGHGSSHGHHGHDAGHMGSNRPHGWRLLFRKLTAHIILPILVGIVAGVSVSIVGMIVATVVVGLWRKIVLGQTFIPKHRCRRHHGASHHKADQMEAAIEEKTSLMENQEDLPPSYEEGEANTADERV